jgi:hypothetical protein
MTEAPGPYPGYQTPLSRSLGQGGGAATAGRPQPVAEMVLSLFAVLTLLAGVLLWVVGNERSAAAAVSDAVATSTAGHSAHVAETASVDVGGTTVSISATGGIDFAQNAAQLTVSGSVAGHQIAETVTFVDGIAYIEDPALGTVQPGKKWISIDVPSLSGANYTGGIDPGVNPGEWMPLLAAQGDQVTPLGPSTVGQTAVQGYTVTVSPSKVQADLTSPSLPAWLRSTLSHVSVGSFSFKVYIDGTNLLRRITVTSEESLDSKTAQVTESILYSDYGTPVTASAPTPSQVVTFQQLFGSQGSTAGSGSTST